MTLSAVSSELRTQFETSGHVILHGVYDVSIAESAAEELSAMRGTRYDKVPGEQRRSIRGGVNPNNHPNLCAVLSGIGQSALTHLGEPLWPTSGAYKRFLVEIIMEPNAEGYAHRDQENLEDSVAITTLRGTSDLRIGESALDIPTYQNITAGSVIYLNNSSRLWHQAVAGDSPRVGLGLARAVPDGHNSY